MTTVKFMVIDTKLATSNPMREIRQFKTRKEAIEHALRVNQMCGHRFGVRSPNGRVTVPLPTVKA